MTIREFKQIAINGLENLYNSKEAVNIAYILLEWITGYSKTSLTLNQEMELSIGESSILLEKMEALQKYTPVQYITGKSWFCGLEMEVDREVMIPRPETEELVQWIIRDYVDWDGLKVLDIGTGSGCIAISLAKFLKRAAVTAIDISPGALAIARRNAMNHDAEINFILMDMLDQEKWHALQGFDIIVSNPPYVRLSEKSDMQPNVLDFEPPSSLFVKDEDPLVYYRAITGIARKKLAKNGSVYVEINEYFGPEMVYSFQQNGFRKVELRKDINGRDRMVRAVKS